MEIKELFEKSEDGTLTYDKFMELAKESKAKFTDLSEGKYVSKSKYDDDLKAKDDALENLNTTLGSRDTDLADLKAKLEAAGADTEALAKLNTDLADLQSKYDTETKNYKNQLKKQAYEFAVREIANGKKFTSNAAKRDFISSMINKELKMDGSNILGAEDFVTAYTATNADAFVVDTPESKPEPSKPQFVNSTQGSEPSVDSTGGFANAFHFTGVRPIPNE